ncbi:MAG: SRPBCC domain-containing protein [Gemmataceae bacterium]
MRFEGSLLLPRTIADVWPLLSDCRWLIQRLPDRTSESLLAEDHAKAVIRPGFSFVRGTLDVELRRRMSEPQSELEYVAASRSVGTRAELTTRMHLNAEDDATRMEWSVEITELGGLLKAVPSGLIRAAAQKAIDDVLANVRGQSSRSA